MQQAAKKQRNPFLKAILLLFVFVIAGTYLADLQMNSLTLESEFSKILNIRYSQTAADGEVKLYVMGQCLSIDEADTAALKPAVESLRHTASDYWQVAQTVAKSMNQLVEKYYTEFL